MGKNELLEALKDLLVGGDFSIVQCKEILIDYRNSGGTQENAEQTVQILRDSFRDNECYEDLILETLDIITGWCSFNLKIW